MILTSNLNTDRFRNGDLIPEAKTNEEWIEAGKNKQPAWSYYDNKSENGEKYGKLYNWYAVNDPRGLAPEGYHIPTVEEMEDFRDEFLDGLLGGCRYYHGRYEDVGYYGQWWSSTEADSYDAGYSCLYYSSRDLDLMYDNKGDGYSVRCVKD